VESSWTLLARRPAGYYFTLNSSGRVPTYLNGTQVLIDGKPAPLLYTSLSQINAIVPYEIEGQRSLCTSLILWSLASLEHSRRARGSRHFHAGLTGAGQAAVLDQDNSVNGPTQPAARGSVIQIFATGMSVAGAITGSITPAPAPGSDPVSVAIGGVTASIQYAGPAPGETAGLIKVNAVVPDNAPTCPAIPIVLTVSPPQSPLQPMVYASQTGAGLPSNSPRRYDFASRSCRHHIISVCGPFTDSILPWAFSRVPPREDGGAILSSLRPRGQPRSRPPPLLLFLLFRLANHYRRGAECVRRALTSVIKSALVGVTATDPATYTVVSLVLALVVALRYE
jgi:uncharacterized protein (TIGR03437 family)